ncbi:hypothetical protein QBC33DRAFT_564699 [Phialemonium atrogriseum]|uniref:Uncharacterized protein n=1 Tax=Phialemonium atrogriseum TaxID=1093897 RepID=A0AAJ0FTJ2_9PEZI|nr:uncharacterized protein QBC33DRAFT_564699 [Phialemonium atrogriseum]KAK1772215.1 hypothetical protein QBC33DRAFT_564699 [Phialemonium atrogriseum]
MDCINTITHACSTTTAAASTATATVTVHVPTWVSTCVPCSAATTKYIFSEESLSRLTDALYSLASAKRLKYFPPGWVFILCFICFIAGEWVGKKKWLYQPVEADNRVLADVDPATAMVDQQQE